MKNKSAIFIYAFVMLFNGSNFSYAQMKPSARGHDKEYKADKSDTVFIDENDSIQKFRHSKEFAYMDNLDSILRKESGLKNDTVRLDENTGKIIRKRKERSDLSAINRILNGKPLQVFFWALACLFIVLISYRLLFKNKIFRIRKNKVIEETEDEYAHGLADVSKYDLLIAEAENADNYNLAIRYLFLKTLKSLVDKGLIGFTPGKTNREYIKEMKANEGAKGFQSLAYNYEYIWYGKFSVDAAAYQHLKEEFYLFNQKV